MQRNPVMDAQRNLRMTTTTNHGLAILTMWKTIYVLKYWFFHDLIIFGELTVKFLPLSLNYEAFLTKSIFIHIGIVSKNWVVTNHKRFVFPDQLVGGNRGLFFACRFRRSFSYLDDHPRTGKFFKTAADTLLRMTPADVRQMALEYPKVTGGKKLEGAIDDGMDLYDPDHQVRCNLCLFLFEEQL